MPMDENQMWKEVNDVFRNVFKTPSLDVKPQTTAADVPQWDSLNHVQLVLAVERRFGVRFKHAQIAAFSNVGDMVAALKLALEARK